MNENINQGKNFLQVEDCFEGKSQNTGNEYWCLKCTVLPDPKVGRQNGAPLESINVYFMKKHEWALQNLQDIVVACGSDKPWNLFGRKFIADVVVKNDFVSLRKPRPYTETEEEPAPAEPAGINAKSEWPW